MYRTARLVAMLVTLAVAAPATTGTDPPAPADVEAARVERASEPSTSGERDGASPEIVLGELGGELDALLTSLAGWGFHGSALVARDDEIILQKGYGLANRERAIANTPDTLFEIASATKHLTATAVLLLEQDGVLSTDDSIARWLPGVPDEDAGVAIHHLLTHTSGFPRMGPTGAGADAEVAVREYLAAGRVREPGEQFEYWNGGYALLAMIIERASGRSFVGFCRERMFRPAGMERTGFCQEAFDAMLLAHGYVDDHDIGSAASASFGWEYRGMGGIVTSIVDLYRWDKAMREGRLLRDPAAKLERPFRSGYACGAWVERSVGETPLLMVAGNVTGFNSMLWRLPEDDAIVIVLCNTPQHGYVVGTHLLRRLLDMEAYLAVPPELIELSSAESAAICGTYRGEAGAVIILPEAERRFRVVIEGQPLVQLFMYGSPQVPEPLSQRIARAERVLLGAASGDLEPLRDAMDPGIPADWPARFRAYWQEKIDERGALVSHAFLGARPTASSPASLRLLYRLHHERCEALAAITLEDDRLLSFSLDVEGAAHEYSYVPTTSSTLETYSIGPGRSPAIRITETGDVVVRAPGGSTLTLQRD